MSEDELDDRMMSALDLEPEHYPFVVWIFREVDEETIENVLIAAVEGPGVMDVPSAPGSNVRMFSNDGTVHTFRPDRTQQTVQVTPDDFATVLKWARDNAMVNHPESPKEGQ